MEKENRKENLVSILESLLLSAAEPLALSKLSKVTGAAQAEVETALASLETRYQVEDCGLVLVRQAGKAQLGTKASNAHFVEKMLKAQLQEELSSAALEVAAVVAYRGPLSRAEIEDVRGVNCSYTLRNLLLRGLVEKMENPHDARGYLYQISGDFLKFLGLARVEELPDYAILKESKYSEKTNQK